MRVLTAVEPVVPLATEFWYDAGSSLERERQTIRTQAETLTEGAAETLRAGGLAAVVRDGDPRSAIVDKAKEWDADLIVLGTQRRGRSVSKSR